MDISLDRLQKRIINKMKITLHPQNVVVMQPSVGAKNILLGNDQCLFESLSPLLVWAKPTLSKAPKSMVTGDVESVRAELAPVQYLLPVTDVLSVMKIVRGFG